MVDRVTRQRPRFYGKMNMTSGFFQTFIDAKSRPYTAFITSFGLYQWCRLPMGLKGAASYSQRMMASVVLAGLLYSIVELYLDDVLVYATSEDELIERLCTVFTRLRQFNITLNPNEALFVLTKPLNDLTTPYRKISSIIWRPQLEELFKQIQEAVGNCPKLYYVDNDLPMHVRTDASGYGIGGYIFQKDGHKELPIRFISKSV
jgi:hypothetical protein